ncbi:MAG: ABC transporter permease [Cytophagales bacterium]|nr:ABC transporter permease [Cytophagales bacterium]
MYQRILANFSIALEAVLANKLRSLLTGLGIIFGVAAVISMMAIGSGAQEEILEQIRLVGVNNIVITPIVEQEESELGEGESEEGEEKNLSSGLTILDTRSIEKTIPGVKSVSPEIIIDTYIIKNARRRSAKLVGVENKYFDLSGFRLDQGKYFNKDHLEYGKPVCVIGKSIKSKFFSKEDPIGKKIKVGSHWLKVIGVLEERHISKKSISNLGIRDYNMDVYAPLQTVLIRYENRALVTEARIKLYNRSNPEEREKFPNYHQLDRLVVQVAETNRLNGVAQVISKLLKRRHNGIVDYEITIPELLLKQQQRTKSIFNFVLGAIAGISLLVGGIGIMNIMLASVLERIKEIGLRMSIGAKKADIAYQFLLEAVMISVTGGLAGVILGSAIAIGVSEVADIPTILSFGSIILSFGVAVSVGVVFGYTPAKRAANQDPITSLRYE